VKLPGFAFTMAPGDRIDVEIPPPFWDFLVSVDADAVDREESFLSKAAGAFMANDCASELDLMGFDVADCSPGQCSPPLCRSQLDRSAMGRPQAQSLLVALPPSCAVQYRRPTQGTSVHLCGCRMHLSA